MSRKKLFIENIFAYGFINILNKIVPFLLLPIVTRMLPDASDFGVYSMYTAIIGFGTPFAVLGLYDAMFREYFEKDDQKYKYDVTTTTQRMVLFSSIFIVLVLVLFSSQLSMLFFGTTEYYSILILAGIGVFIGANNSTIQAPTRMQNQRKVYVFSGLFSSISMYAIAITLIYLGYAYFGLIYASIVSSVLLLIFFWIRNYNFFLKGNFDKTLAKKLLKTGLPLLPTFLIYWLFKSMDIIMITNILDTNQLGIYSIGSKIGHVSMIIYSAFAGGFAFFKYSTMKDSDQVAMNSKLFDYLFGISVFAFILVTPFMQLVFRILFVGEYVQGYIVAPYLFIAPLILMSFQVLASQFIVVRKSYITSLSLLFGAIINIYLNYVLINIMGIKGVAIATLIGYILSLLIISILAYKNNLLILSKEYCINSLIFAINILLLIFLIEMTYLNIIVSIMSSLIIIFLYKDEVKLIIKYAHQKFNGKGK